jgi:succinyl-CoA synthetase alpha subunit
VSGYEEERATAFVSDWLTKPVVPYVAGFTPPPGKQMGPAGAMITGSSETAQKAEALEAAGARVRRRPTEVAELVQDELR